MIKTNVERLLENAKIPFTPYEYDVSDGQLDAISIARKIGKDQEQVFKTLVTEAPGPEYFVFVIPGPATLDLKKAARAAKVKSIAMIPQKKLLPLTGYIHGGCSPIGMKKLLPTFLDETAILYDTICVSAGKVGTNVELNPETLAEYISAPMVDLTV
ncbi:MAG: Cys-tRNA(Pro) deacylase [Lentisphaeria bacterium]|nr:Cys-tRNA(Pro) deacylase [Lentisphaeria bacterium]